MTEDLTVTEQTASCITEERIAAMRAKIGVCRPVAGWNHTVTFEGIQRFARGIGDDNPLWWDAVYAAASPLGGPTAPPCYLYSHANDMPDTAIAGSGPFTNHLPGALALWAGERWRWSRPVRVGETISCEQSLAEVRVDAGGRKAQISLTQIEREEFRTADGELVAEHWQTFKRFDKQALQAAAPGEGRAPSVYGAGDRDAFAEHYRNERRRGGEPRYIEDVAIDAPIAPMLKGPLTLGNMIGFMLGWGNSLGATNRMLSRQLTEFPEARVINPETGVCDGIIAYHWEPALARAAGIPGGYDFGCQRSAWISHFLTDWAGDHGFLAALEVRLRRPNVLNDVSWIHGRVTAVDLARATADLAISVINQLGEESARATATVRLPRRPA